MALLDNVKKGGTKRQPRIMMIGVEGVGKSTAGASMPNPLFICCENRLVGPQFENTDSIVPKSWDDIIKTLDELIADSHGYKTLVIDTLDWMEPMLYTHVCTKAGYKNIEDFGYGKGYVVAQQEARQLIVRLEKLNFAGMNIMLLAHSIVKTVNNPAGDNYDRYEGKMNAKIGGLFKEWCDVILFAHFDMYTKKDGTRTKAFGGDGRIVQTTHSAAWDAKNCFGLPEVMPLDMTAIMEAITQGQPQDVEALKSEFMGYVKGMRPDIAQKATKWLESGKWTVQQLAQKVNSYRVKESVNNNVTDKKEADNG